MELFRYHVFVCDQQKPEGVPCCAARGSGQVLEALRREVNAHGLKDEVQVTACDSMGLCEHGPNLVVYPEGIWYSGVTPADVPEIVRSHFQEDTPVERLAGADPAVLRAEIRNHREKMFAARRAREAAGALPDDRNERIRALQESRALLTALELDLFTAVGDGAGAVEVATRLGADPRATEMLLNALASLRLLVKREGVFHNSPASRVGKKENCQVAVSLSVATATGSLPIAWRLYLPEEWVSDPERRSKADVPSIAAYGFLMAERSRFFPQPTSAILNYAPPQYLPTSGRGG